MHRFWSDGRWNKITLAHGCYWKKCSFCDVSLDYIGRYDKPSTDVVMQRIRALIAETGETGFHLVDEAAPPAGMRSLAKRLIAEKLGITWWGNIRFEKTFTPELCQPAGRVRLRGRERRARSGVGPVAGAHEERRHGRAGGARDARVHRCRHHGARLSDVRLPDGDRAGHHRRARTRAPAVRGGLHPVGVLASLLGDGAFAHRPATRTHTASRCGRRRTSTFAHNDVEFHDPDRHGSRLSRQRACARRSTTTCTASASMPTCASGSSRAEAAAGGGSARSRGAARRAAHHGAARI